MTKIDIISGFLGAGKTTLIKKLLQEALQNEKLVLIENEFGEIGIDGGFLKDAGIEIKEMNSGCICCSLVGDFSEALKKVLETYSPDRIIIEPSGVGKLSDVVKAVKGVADSTLEINSITTVVDAQKCNMYMKNFGEFFNNQIEYAKTIVLSRSQKLSDENLHEVVHELKEHNGAAHIITTEWDKLDGKEILNVMENQGNLEYELLQESEVCPECGHVHNHDEHHHTHEHCECHHDHEEHDGHACDCNHEHHHKHSCGCTHEHHHHADEVFTSVGMETVQHYDKEELESILKQLSESDEYGTILRAKGMLEDKEGKWMYFDLVPHEYEIREGQPTYTGRFCIIGSKLQEEKLKELFKM